jgi:RNA polymerase sigma-70 factor, ECF subfamily
MFHGNEPNRVALQPRWARPAEVSRLIAVVQQLESHRMELTAFCRKMLGALDAEDAVQETFIRALRKFDQFEGRGTLRSWLYRIATNVCFDMLESRKRRPRPMDLGPAREPTTANPNTLTEATWIEPITDGRAVSNGDPAYVMEAHETVRHAFAALQHLPPKQRGVLILCEVLRWKTSEAAELLETSVASVASALQRARATLEMRGLSTEMPIAMRGANSELLARYVEAFERYDMDALTALIHQDSSGKSVTGAVR